MNSEKIESAQISSKSDLKTLIQDFEQHISDIAGYHTIDITINSWGEKIEFEFSVYSDRENLSNGRSGNVMGKGKTYDEALADFKSKIK